MNYKSFPWLSVLMLAFVVTFTACEDDPKMPANLVEFEAEVAGLASDQNSLTININLSRAASADATLVLNVNSGTLQYGVDFTTTPAMEDQTLTVTIPKGETQAVVTLNRMAGVEFTEDATIVFTLTAVEGTQVIGTNNKITVSFYEITVTTGSINIQGGGDTYPNSVFIDLSANRQTAVKRDTWDLGFFSGADFRVTLNAANGMMAYALDKNDLNGVTNADTALLRNRLSIDGVFAAITSTPSPEWVSSAINWIDDPAGDLTKTAIAEISATASENKVYIINRGSKPGLPATGLGWKKIRVIRNGSGYTLQHADINATTFSEIQITKNEDYEFQYVSFANGVVTVEPMRTRWDIAWSGLTSSTNFGSGPVPYYYQDMIFQNRNNVETVQVSTSVKTYEAFTAADIAGLNFGTQSRIKIGSSWRAGGGPNLPAALHTDRFYVIKDAEGNYYKLKFTALTTDGERGRPAIQYALLQAAE